LKYHLECTSCRNREPDSAFRCSKCKSILEVVYDYSGLGGALPKEEKICVSRYSGLLPIKGDLFSLGEGGTRLAMWDEDVSLKLEMMNPTRTFKDRGSSVEITKALELGFDHVCCASTGNMGLSVAHYARRARIRATIFISGMANPEKIKKIEREGAQIVKVNGDFNKALVEAEKFATKEEVMVCGDYHFRKEGQKTVALEIVEQRDYKAPDFIFVPVGNGTLFSGMYKGLKEFKRAGLMDKMPKLVAVQSEKCNPLVVAYQKGREINYVRPNTAADAIAVGYPTFGFECIKGIKATGGFAVSVSEDEIAGGVRLLERKRIFAELGGGTGFAGYLRAAKENGRLLSGKEIVVVITGNNEGRFK
jgi:threonine synthase